MSGTHGTHRKGFGTESVLLSAERVAARQALLSGAAKLASDAKAEQDKASKAEAMRRVSVFAGPLQAERDSLYLQNAALTIGYRRALERSIALAHSVRDLSEEVEALESDLVAVLEASDDELRKVIRTFLGARHRKGPGAQQVVRDALDRMAVLSGYIDLDDEP